MRTMFLAVSFLQLLTLAQLAIAQARGETEFVAAVAVLKTCPLTPPNDIANDGRAPSGESLSALGGAFLAGLTGDLVTAGLNALGGALEEASREKGFSALGSTSFNFYVVNRQDVYGIEEVTLRPDLLAGSSQCLVISYSAKPSFGGEDPSTASELAANGLGETDPAVVSDLKARGQAGAASVAWANAGLPQNPDVYVEAALQSRLDGFIVRPSLVWYRHAFPKAPKKESPAELHASFSIPSGPTGETAAVFALARLRLPSVTPGNLIRADALKAYSSGVLPVRPTDGSPEKTRVAFASAFSSQETNKEELEKAQRSLSHAKAAAAAQDAKEETKAKVQPLEDQVADLIAKQAIIAKRINAINSNGLRTRTGSTNVGARFTVVRRANQFGLAVANALKGRAKAMGEAITTELTPDKPTPAWTASDTGYVTAMGAVATAQRALDTAMAGTDADAIFSAQIALKNAKAAANAAAAASDRPIPYPDVI